MCCFFIGRTIPLVYVGSGAMWLLLLGIMIVVSTHTPTSGRQAGKHGRPLCWTPSWKEEGGIVVSDSFDEKRGSKDQ